MGALVQIAAAAALPPGTHAIDDPYEVVGAFGTVLGPLGSVVIALGLWAAVFTTFLASNTGYSLVAADICGILAARGATVPVGDRPAYRWVLLGFVISPLYALWTNWSPVWLVLIASAMELVLMPLVAALLFLLTSRKDSMGSLVNGRAMNGALILLMIASVALIGQTIWEWL